MICCVVVFVFIKMVLLQVVFGECLLLDVFVECLNIGFGGVCKFSMLGLYILCDVLYVYLYCYEDCCVLFDLVDVEEGQKVIVMGMVVSKFCCVFWLGMLILEIVLEMFFGGWVKVMWFN